MANTRYGEHLDEEGQAFSDAVDSFCLRECPPDQLRKWTDNGRIAHSPELYARLAETGWLGLSIPEEYGGVGGTLKDVAILMERLSYHRLPVGGYVTSSITEQAIIRYGTEEQKRTILPEVAAGAILSIAITEPDTGSDAASITTAARRVDSGWRINGQKIYTTNANHARWVVLVTRTNPEAPKHHGISLFCLPMDRDGISYSQLNMLGNADTNITYYEDVAARDEEILGTVDEGWSVLTRGLNSERVIIAAVGLGYGQRAFDDAVAYAKTRTQFGHPIARFQALQHGFAETATKLAAARLLTYHAAELIDSGKSAPVEASMAKLLSSETAKEAALQGMQFMGGMGYSMESDMQAYVRDTLVMTVFGGTSQIQKNIIAGGLGLTR